LLRFSLQNGAYEYESCACFRDPGEKCGLDDLDLEPESYQTINFDGRNWGQAAAILNEQQNSNTPST
jgi:hypothetical protein